MKWFTPITRVLQILMTFVLFVISLFVGAGLGFCLGVDFCLPWIPTATPNNRLSPQWIQKLIPKSLKHPQQISQRKPDVKNKHLTQKRTHQHKEDTTMSISKQAYGLTYGKETAPHHLINFFDIGCTHCATFFQETWPTVRTFFVETGKLRVTFTPYPIHSETLLFMSCAEKLYTAQLI